MGYVLENRFGKFWLIHAGGNDWREWNEVDTIKNEIRRFKTLLTFEQSISSMIFVSFAANDCLLCEKYFAITSGGYTIKQSRCELCPVYKYIGESCTNSKLYNRLVTLYSFDDDNGAHKPLRIKAVEEVIEQLTMLLYQL